jgi:hypothetical protein
MGPSLGHPRGELTGDAPGGARMNRGVARTPETETQRRKKISVAKRGRPLVLSPETRARLSALRRRPLSPEHRAHISAALRASPKARAQRARLAAWHRGQSRSPTTRTNISAGVTAWWQRQRGEL